MTILSEGGVCVVWWGGGVQGTGATYKHNLEAKQEGDSTSCHGRRINYECCGAAPHDLAGDMWHSLPNLVTWGKGPNLVNKYKF